MNRYCFYIDGLNMHYALRNSGRTKRKGEESSTHTDGPYFKYMWLNYWSLAESLIRAKDKVTGIFYFTTVPAWRAHASRAQREYIQVLKSRGIKVIQGRFHEKTVQCHKCKRWYLTHEEKRSDVELVLKLFGDAVDDLYDKAVIISADSDLTPLVKAVQKRFPNKEIGIMFPIGRRSDALIDAATFHLKMSERLLINSQFPEEVNVDGKIIKKPLEWSFE